jgi:cell division protease FtsH
VAQFWRQQQGPEPVTFAQFIEDARSVDIPEGARALAGVSTVVASGQELRGELLDGTVFRSVGDLGGLDDLRGDLVRRGVLITYLEPGLAFTGNLAQGPFKDLAFSDLLKEMKRIPTAQELKDGLKLGVPRVESLVVKGESVFVKYSDGQEKVSRGRLDAYEPGLLAMGIDISHEEEEKDGLLFQFLISWVPMIFLFGLFIFFLRQMQGGGGKAMSFGKSRHRILNQQEIKITFDDIAGIDEAKEELQEIISFLRDPKKFTRLGGRIPKGVLLMGPPGTGKTLLAKGVAGEAGVPFFSISGSDFVEMFVGVGASRVRDLFEQGKKHAPCIIFIDEIDAVGRHRGAGVGGGHDEREQTLNQLLVEMDGFESNEGVILIAATNRPDVLDPALMRPGRFDRRVVVNLPDLKGRVGILKVHTQKIPMAPGVDLEITARGTPGFSGADLQNLVNEAALLAARREAEVVDIQDFEAAKDKVVMGTERRSLVLSEEDKRTTAYHEGGHALVAAALAHADPLYKVTIVPRGLALGLTQLLPERDKHSYSKDWILDRICVTMGGRAAEELVFNDQTTGAGQDIDQATELARKMVCVWGMSELGPVSYESRSQEVFIGRDLAKHKTFSEATAELIDKEIRRIVEAAWQKAMSILKTRRGILDELAAELIRKETLNRQDLEDLLARHGLKLGGFEGSVV